MLRDGRHVTVPAFCGRPRGCPEKKGRTEVAPDRRSSPFRRHLGSALGSMWSRPGSSSRVSTGVGAKPSARCCDPNLGTRQKVHAIVNQAAVSRAGHRANTHSHDGKQWPCWQQDTRVTLLPVCTSRNTHGRLNLPRRIRRAVKTPRTSARGVTENQPRLAMRRRWGRGTETSGGRDLLSMARRPLGSEVDRPFMGERGEAMSRGGTQELFVLGCLVSSVLTRAISDWPPSTWT